MNKEVVSFGVSSSDSLTDWCVLLSVRTLGLCWCFSNNQAMCLSAPHMVTGNRLLHSLGCFYCWRQMGQVQGASAFQLLIIIT